MSTSCELYRIIANTNPHLLIKCKQLLYDLVGADKSFSAMVGLILSQGKELLTQKAEQDEESKTVPDYEVVTAEFLAAVKMMVITTT